MQITNFYSKTTFKILFIASVFITVANVAVVFTPFAVFPEYIHLILAVLFAGAAVYIMLKNYFIKYDSYADSITIERSALFSFSRKPKARSFDGYRKYDIREYTVENKWYGTVLLLKYETHNGETEEARIPFRFFSARHANVLNKDLKRILNTDFHMFIGSGFRNPNLPQAE